MSELGKNQVTVDPRRVEKLERRVKEFQDVYSQIHAQFAKSEAAVQKLDEKIKAVGADKVEAQQSRINTIKKELDGIKSAISKAKVSYSYCEISKYVYNTRNYIIIIE